MQLRETKKKGSEDLMGGLFSDDPPPPAVPSTDEVILELKHQKDDLLKYEKKVKLSFTPMNNIFS